MTDTLKQISGVGPARAKKLSQANYTVKKLARANPQTVAKKTGLSKKVAQKTVSAAKKVAEIPPKPASTTSKKPSQTKKKSTAKTSRLKTKNKKTKKAVSKPTKKSASTKKQKKRSRPTNDVSKRLATIEHAIKELTSTVGKLDARLKKQRSDLHEAQHQLEYLSWDALPRVVHELAWYIRTHLESWSEDKVFAWLKDHGHEERHIRHALTIARGA